MNENKNKVIHTWTTSDGSRLRLAKTGAGLVLELATADSVGGDSWRQVLALARGVRGQPHARWLAEAVTQLAGGE